MRPLKKIKMNRFFKALGLASIITFSVACNKDDETSIAPPRDYTVQYATEKEQIEEYLKTHYISFVDANYTVGIDTLNAEAQANGEISLWDDSRRHIKETLNNNVMYEIHYIVLNQGIGSQPTKFDQVDVAYKGWQLTPLEEDWFDTPFDIDPFGGSYFPVMNYIDAWTEIIPLFNAGVYNDSGNAEDPASYTDFGAGIMFVPSGLAYYNSSAGDLPAYTPSAFSFKLFRSKVLDTDGDGIPNQYETDPGINIEDYDTDGDGVPNYQDTDDDNDGYPTRDEITIPGTNEVYSFGDIPSCVTGTKRHVDASCNQNFDTNE